MIAERVQEESVPGILFVDDLGTVDVRARHCGVCTNTIVQWDQWFRDVIVESFLEEQQPRRIGGPNKQPRPVEASEIHTTDSSFHLSLFRREMMRNDSRSFWDFVGVIETTTHCFPSNISGPLDIAQRRSEIPLDRIEYCVVVHRKWSTRPQTVFDVNLSVSEAAPPLCHQVAGGNALAKLPAHQFCFLPPHVPRRVEVLQTTADMDTVIRP
ncbi:unnamed protein product [Heligmosomoides polygyrus]|uniref:Uncharacterized protein n=1 Tax=Heligmosomoides polygyrus TaxID=6339 RepID=A0A183GDN2_HELPZ|nr:unnamed protein product [Heligmosomoides polygyrus]